MRASDTTITLWDSTNSYAASKTTITKGAITYYHSADKTSYSNPPRFYKDTTFTISLNTSEAKTITSVVATCSSNDYAKAFGGTSATVTGGGSLTSTVTGSSSTYTKTFTGTGTITKIAFKMSAQSRVSSLVVAYKENASVKGITLSPSDDVTLAVGKSKSFTVGITGSNLTGDEEVDLSFTEGGDGLTLSAIKAKNGDEITVTATASEVIDELVATYETVESNKITITTEEAKAPTKLKCSGTPITSYIAGQSFDPTGLSFKVYYGDEDTTGSDVDVEHIAFSPSTLTVETTSVTGSYTENNETVSFSISGITVEADYIVDILFDTDNAKTTYQIGEDWANSETGVTGLGEYKVNKDTLLDLTATDFTYSGYDSTIGGEQTITVSYPNPKSETPFSTTYTITVKSETLEKDGVYQIVTDYTTLSAGDKIVIAENTKGVVPGDFTIKSGTTYNDFLPSIIGSTFKDKNTITSLATGALVFTLDGDSTAWHLLNDNGDMLGATAAKKLTWDSSAQNYNANWTFSSFTTTTNGVTYTGTAITNGGSNFGKILYNCASNVNPTRFLNYTSDVSLSMLIPQIYKFTGGTHEASLALVNTVKSIYNDGYLTCDSQGLNSTIKWTEIANLFTTNVTDAEELAFLKEALSDETAANGTIKKFLADYDYILNKYNAAPYSKGYTDFLNRGSSSNSNSNTINKLHDNKASIITIVLVSTIAITTIGGCFFLRKKKEN